MQNEYIFNTDVSYDSCNHNYTFHHGRESVLLAVLLFKLIFLFLQSVRSISSGQWFYMVEKHMDDMTLARKCNISPVNIVNIKKAATPILVNL